MTEGTLTFDGADYPDGPASDPRTMGWMQGSPPPLEKRIGFERDQFANFPELRWSLSHMRELTPTVSIWRGHQAPSPLGDAPSAGDEAAIDELRFADMQGRQRRWRESQLDTYTDGVLVLHRGRRVYERYFGELRPERPHACFSITKSYAATLAATLIHEGTLDERQPVAHYLPELRGTAYRDATLRDVMDMQVGIAYSELYADSKSDIWAYARAGGFRWRSPDDVGPANFYDYLQTLRKEGEHGQAFAYKTPNTEVLCWVMKRVTGMGLAEMLSQRFWAPLGCEEDGYLGVDSIGVPMGGGGLSATLRDLARFGEMMRCDGAWRGHQRVPEAVVADIRRGSDPAKFAKAGYVLLSGYSYRSMWWVSHNDLGAFEARGIHGQRLYIAPKAEMVVARFASHPIAASAANDPITLPAFAALARMLNGR
jgi:CubicO group peptidase (beta-lactamase class C family)